MNIFDKAMVPFTTGRVHSTVHIDEKTRKLVQSDSSLIKKDEGQDRPVCKGSKPSTLLPSLKPDERPFKFNNENTKFSINNVELSMQPADVVSFIDNLQLIKGVRYFETNGSPKNTYTAWCEHLLKSNYKKVYECDTFCIYAVLSDMFENLIMFEIVYKTGGAKHVNIAVDLSKYRL